MHPCTQNRPVLVARFSFECIVYLTFQPCSCGDDEIPTVRNGESAGHNVANYEMTCGTCNERRRVEVVIGGDDNAASTIVDAGQWLLAAEWSARRVPVDLASLTSEQRSFARIDLERAVVALDEALKFILSDRDEVPREALFSPEGLGLHVGEPGRFRRPRIEAVRSTCRAAPEALNL